MGFNSLLTELILMYDDTFHSRAQFKSFYYLIDATLSNTKTKMPRNMTPALCMPYLTELVACSYSKCSLTGGAFGSAFHRHVIVALFTL